MTTPNTIGVDQPVWNVVRVFRHSISSSMLSVPVAFNFLASLPLGGIGNL